MRVKNDMPPPASDESPDDPDLNNRMVSGSSEFIRRKSRPNVPGRCSIISSYHEKPFCSPDVVELKNTEFQASTPTRIDVEEEDLDFSKHDNNCTFDISQPANNNDRVLNRNATFSLEDNPNISTASNSSKPDIQINESYVIQKGNATFDFPPKADMLSAKVRNETFSKNCDVEMENSDTSEVSDVSDKPKRPSSWTDCGPRTFILGAAGNFMKSFQVNSFKYL